MKKRLEAELISIAHRILKLKNKSEIDQLYKETRKLYEALSILKFHEENYAVLKNEVSHEEIEQKVESFLAQEEITTPIDLPIVEAEPIAEAKEEIIETIEQVEEEEPIVVGEIILEEEDEVEDESFEDNDVAEAKDKEDHESDALAGGNFKPAFELSFEAEDETETEEEPEIEAVIEETQPEVIEEKKPEPVEAKQVTMDDIFGDSYKEPVFVKPNEVTLNDKFISVFDQEQKEKDEPKVVSLNDVLSNSISISLNDRVAFVKHLFNESNEDYNRVLSQLNTFDTFADAKNFLNEMVIPEYNYWVGKEEYLERFLEIVEKKFK
ncbi:hypothetical protein [Flavobacterium dankookense]|uniref:Uncharacterized protein n=1 Tax=Flavobacterium dankookense TaxID=706186 RepID=A0A4R6QDB0_9FLAO|nr:hypothetical protein [Flavobacterium dankookense]TDP60290.1 hypothetical protein BC748_1272 [Flavobacterium dankookense]